MKRFLSIIIAIALSLGTLPLAAFAAVDAKSQEFQNYLTEIGMTESEFITYLEEFQDATLNDFDNLEDLEFILGPLVDDQNLQELLNDLEITQEELDKLLEENGKTLDQYTFIGDLYFDVTNWIYPETQTPITDETLQTFLEDFDFATKTELESFLKEYNDSIENYKFIEELESAVAGYYLAEAEEELMAALESLGLTMEETERLANYFVSLMEDPNFNEETFMASMEDISNRLLSFGDFESASDLTAEQIAEFIDIWDDLLNLLELKVEYYLLKDGKETPISFASLILMDDIDGSDLVIKIYTKSGQFLADMIITKEMFGSDFVEETGKNLKDTKKAAEEVKKAVDKAPAKAPAKTVNGGKLPNTASDYLQNTMAGLAFVLLGAFAFRKVKTRRA